MIATSLQPASLDSGRIVIPTRFQAENLGFLRSLPEARWAPKRGAWTVLATPCTAARLRERGYSADLAVSQLAASWRDGLQCSAGLESQQPPLRKTDARLTQRRAYWFCREKPAAMMAVRMGLGKSKAAVDLAWNCGCKRVLVLCPKSVIGVWPRELAKHGPDNYVCLPLDTGTAASKVSRADATLSANAGRMVVVVVNYETAIQPAFAKWSCKQTWDLVVADESHRIKQASGKASKLLFEVGQHAERRLALTGTPMPHSPLDLFAQYRFLDAGIFGSSWVAFRQRYAITSEQFKSQVLEYINQDELSEKFQQIGFVATSTDELDLPPVSHETIGVELPAAVLSIYHDLEEEMTVALEGRSLDSFIDAALDGEVTADNALVKLLRLQQIASGHVRTDDEAVVEIHREKAAALAELIDGLPQDEPVVVFCQYRHNLQQIKRVAETLGRRYGEISGERKDLGPGATYPDGVGVLGVQWQAGSVGIDLTRSRYGVIYTPTFNGGNFEQGLARQHRPGQTRPTFFYHLLSTGTIDHAVYGALKKRGTFTEAVLHGGIHAKANSQ